MEHTGSESGKANNQRKSLPLRGDFFFGGAYWTRTSDPIDVNDVLYQLSQSTVLCVPQVFLTTKSILSQVDGFVNP